MAGWDISRSNKESMLLELEFVFELITLFVLDWVSSELRFEPLGGAANFTPPGGGGKNPNPPPLGFGLAFGLEL